MTEIKRRLTVGALFEYRRESLLLEFMNPDVSLDQQVGVSDLSSPGLGLAGYTDRFPEGRMQVFGETEMTYLATLDSDTAGARLEGLLRHRIPAIFVSKGQAVPEILLSLATRRGVPVFRSALTTGLIFQKLKPYLETALAPMTHLHGSLADVYGVGLLFIGKSGIGKSECVLDLVERGHRLVADDLIVVTRRGLDILIGEGPQSHRHHMEIRGIGIIDIRSLFGIRAIRQQKRIEVIVQLEMWDDVGDYDRTGLVREETAILDVTIPRVVVPLNPGKNITVISEVVAMNHLLRYAGVDSALLLEKRLKETMQPSREDLEEDYE